MTVEYLTTTDASKRLNCSPQTIQAMIEAKIIEGFQIGQGTQRKRYRVVVRNGEISHIAHTPQLAPKPDSLGTIHPSIERALRKSSGTC